MPLSFEPNKQSSNLNYMDKNLWAALYGDEVETLKEKIQQRIKPKEVNAKLRALQSMIGRLTLSPVVYSLGLLDLQKFLRAEIKQPEIYLEVIKEIRSEWRNMLREQKAFALENFFMDVCQAINNVAEAKWEVQVARDVLNYYFKLIDEPFYQQTVNIAKNFFNEFFISEFTQEEGIQILAAEDMQDVIHQLQQIFNAAVSTLPNVNEIRQEAKTTEALNVTYPHKVWSSVKGIGQYILDHPIQSVVMGLAAQTAAVTAFGSSHFLDKRALGDEIQINTFNISIQFEPVTTSLGNNNFVVVWASLNQDGSDFGIFGRIFNSGLAPISGEFRVNTYTNNTQNIPAITSLNNNNFVVVWEGEGQADSYGINGQLFDGTANLIGLEFPVNTNTTNIQNLPNVASFSDGRFVVVWQSLFQDGSSWGVYGQLFNNAGMRLGNEFKANTYTDSVQGYPVVATLNNGNFVIVWHDGNWRDGGNFGIFGQLFDSTAGLIGNDFQINTYTSGNQNIPAVTSLNNGNFVVTWFSSGQDGSSYGIYGQLFNNIAGKISNEFSVNNYTEDYQGWPAIAGLNDGSFVIGWASRRDLVDPDHNYVDFGIYGQLFNTTAGKVGTEFQINTYIINDQQNCSIAVANNNFLVVWDSYGQDNSEQGVYGKLFTQTYLFPSSSSSSDSTTGSQLTTGANTSESPEANLNTDKSASMPLIIGSVVGGTALCGIASFGAVLFWKRHQQQKQIRTLEKELELDQRRNRIQDLDLRY